MLINTSMHKASPTSNNRLMLVSVVGFPKKKAATCLIKKKLFDYIHWVVPTVKARDHSFLFVYTSTFIKVMQDEINFRHQSLQLVENYKNMHVLYNYRLRQWNWIPWICVIVFVLFKNNFDVELKLLHIISLRTSSFLIYVKKIPIVNPGELG